MEYTIPESDLNRLEDAKNMLGMVSSLLADVTTAHTMSMTHGELLAFVGNQYEILRAVIDRANERYDLDKDSDRSLSWIDWMAVMDVCSNQMHPSHANRTTARMEEIAAMDPDMAPVLRKWREFVEGSAVAPVVAPEPENLIQPEQLKKAIRRGRASAIDAVTIGKSILVLKAGCRHGEYQSRLDQLDISDRGASRYIAVAVTFSDKPKVLQAVGSKSKLFELLPLEDEQVSDLEKGIAVGDLTLESVESMTVLELRKAVKVAIQPERLLVDKKTTLKAAVPA